MKTSENKKRILEKILSYRVFPEDMANNILQELQNESLDWDLTRIKKYWSNNKENLNHNFFILFIILFYHYYLLQ